MSLNQEPILNPSIEIPGTLREKIVSLMAKECDVDKASLTPDAELDTLGFQSIDVVMLLQDVEEKFDIYIPLDGAISEAKTVEEFVQALGQVILAGDSQLAT